MLTFDGQRDFPLPPPALWAKLRDARFLVHCIPEGTVKGTPTQERGECSVRPPIAFLGGSLDVSVSILEAVEPGLVRIQLASKGIATSSEVEVKLDIQAKGDGSHVDYHADVNKLGGLLKAVPSGLIRGSAQKIIDGVWDNVAQKVAGSN